MNPQDGDRGKPDFQARIKMKQLPIVLMLLLIMLAVTRPALAQEENPLAHAVLFTGTTGWALVGLAALLMVLFILWTRRGPN